MPAHIAYTQKLNCPININLSHSCGQALSLNELLALDSRQIFQQFSAQALAYASVQGLRELRQAILAEHLALNNLSGAELPSNTTPEQNNVISENLSSEENNKLSEENVVTFAGAQEALAAIYQSLLAPGDEVIVFTPNYPSLTNMVTSLGATLIAIPLEFEQNWAFDLDKLKASISSKTKLIVINAPHNPTGAVLTKVQRQQLLKLAKQADCYLLSDDVSQAMIIADEPSQLIGGQALAHDFLSYEKSIVVSVMSKSFGLAGVRIGWAISPNMKLVKSLLACKAQSSICTSLIDEQLALIALQHSATIITRNRQQLAENIAIFQKFIDEYQALFQWVKPSAGLMTLVKFTGDIEFTNWLADFTQSTGVLLLPSYLFGLEGNYFRLGLGQQDFSQGLNLLESYIKNNLLSD